MSDWVTEMTQEFQEAVNKAVKQTHQAGIPTSHIEDGKLVRVHPDGRREVVENLIAPTGAEKEV